MHILLRRANRTVLAVVEDWAEVLEVSSWRHGALLFLLGLVFFHGAHVIGLAFSDTQLLTLLFLLARICG